MTLNNIEARFTGRLDIPLSPLGERQVAQLADALAREPINALVSSDLRRARQTAEAIAARHSPALGTALDPALRETSMGEWEGQALADVMSADAERYAAWRADPVHRAPPGGETLAHVLDRLHGALDRWHGQHADGTVVWVTHGGVIAVLLANLLGTDQLRRGQLRRDNASITELLVEGASATLVRLNDTHHLRQTQGEDTAEHYQVM